MKNIIREAKKEEIKNFMEDIKALYEDDTHLLSKFDIFMSLLENYENVGFHTLRGGNESIVYTDAYGRSRSVTSPNMGVVQFP